MSPPIVLKFGGAALGTPARVRLAARRVAAWRATGRPVVAVVSARGRSTEQILRQAREVDGCWERAGRELDRALATGERLSASLLAAALLSRDIPALGLDGGEAGILATGEHGRGRVLRVVPERLLSLLARGVVPVVAGFQAARPDGETLTLGRGTSDLTAAHLAVALGASALHLVKDVEGVHERDPRHDPEALLRPRLTHAELEALAAAGAGVVHVAAARLAGRHRLPIRVCHYRSPAFGDHGTLVEAAPPAERPAKTGGTCLSTA